LTCSVFAKLRRDKSAFAELRRDKPAIAKRGRKPAVPALLILAWAWRWKIAGWFK